MYKKSAKNNYEKTYKFFTESNTPNKSLISDNFLKYATIRTIKVQY